MYNWTEEKITISELYEIARIKEQAHEVVGVDLYWNDTNIGVSLLIFNPYEILFGININRKYIDEKAQLIDFNWYATKILLGLNDVFNIAQYSFSFSY